ncbi:carbohydrate ABC transporter permease [Cohnella phaseoli]|uniref:Raffinose/stachyose/melibiose transport system permease protein n=1 Tax=Cohnella phaseoli TaxID=456490 RepID=A0A3D9KDH4_9BACL|nr:carbohydrate ABC transporter permease [Cohnella phaseoli]RED83949.1 raffinose/stachyose/melibiose transport system permease protein [Cohnella phaseoli]
MRKRIGKPLLELVLVVAAFFYFFPVLMMILGSFKSSMEASAFDRLWPEVWEFGNFRQVLSGERMLQSLSNSVIISMFSIVLTVVLAAVASFVTARRQSRFASGAYFLFIAGLVAPLMYIPTIKTLQFLSLMNTFTGLILVVVATNLPFAVFLFTGFIKGIPRELDESAFVDGFGTTRIFWSIILPLLAPVIATQSILMLVGVWNDLSMPLFFLNDSSKWTLPMLVYNFISQYVRNWNLVYAFLILVSLPVVVLFIAGQKHFVSGLMSGAVKG